MSLIGNTPMIKLDYKYNEYRGSVFAKLEYYNLTGSIKDRMAEYIIKIAQETGKLKKGQPIIEATSGNTGISFAALGARMGHPVHIFMPDWVSPEREKLMRAYGASIYLISKEDGGFLECIKRADKLATDIQGFRPNQFSNEFNMEAHYKTTAKEIIEQTKDCNIKGFITGVGTSGTLSGIAKKLKEFNDEIKIFALEPEELPVISTGDNTGSHKIEGIGDDFVPDLYDADLIEKVITIKSDDAINMSKMLAGKMGLGVGISAGANMLGAILMGQEIGGDIVTVFADDNKKYLSTELFEDKEYDVNLVSNKVELLSYRLV